MFSSDEIKVLKALKEFMNTTRALDNGKYDTVIVPVWMMLRLLNHYDSTTGSGSYQALLNHLCSELEVPGSFTFAEAVAWIKINRIKSDARIWEPEVVSCAHCHVHLAINSPDDLEAFIALHKEKCASNG